MCLEIKLPQRSLPGGAQTRFGHTWEATLSVFLLLQQLERCTLSSCCPPPQHAPHCNYLLLKLICVKVTDPCTSEKGSLGGCCFLPTRLAAFKLLSPSPTTDRSVITYSSPSLLVVAKKNDEHVSLESHCFWLTGLIPVCEVSAMTNPTRSQTVSVQLISNFSVSAKGFQAPVKEFGVTWS